MSPYLRKNDVVLDVGCGTGDLLPFINSHNAAYTGLDLSNEMIGRAHSNHKDILSKGHANFKVADCEKLPTEHSSIDFISSVALIEYLRDPTVALKEIYRVLKPDGYFVITVPHKSCMNVEIRDIFSRLRNLCFPVYLKLNGNALSAMRNVKHYHYDPEELDKMMTALGLTKVDGRFTNFYAIPHPVDHLIPNIYIKLSEKIDRSGSGNKYAMLAANYIALYRK